MVQAQARGAVVAQGLPVVVSGQIRVRVLRDQTAVQPLKAAQERQLKNRHRLQQLLILAHVKTQVRLSVRQITAHQNPKLFQLVLLTNKLAKQWLSKMHLL